MNKIKLLSELHVIIASRLRGSWLVKDESQLSLALRALDLVLRGEKPGAGGGASQWLEKDSNVITPGPRPMSLGEEINFEFGFHWNSQPKRRAENSQEERSD